MNIELALTLFIPPADRMTAGNPESLALLICQVGTSVLLTFRAIIRRKYSRGSADSFRR